MAQIKKNQMTNIIFPMVDGTDFASLESGITASDFNSAATKKYYGVTHGNSTAFTSGTISKAATLVRSGIFQQTLKAAETNYDYLLVRFVHPSCADQLLVFNTRTYDDSDTYSQLSDIGSNLLSYLTGMSGMLSDVDSQLLLTASLVSDIDSQLLLNASLISDVDSQVNLLATSNYLSQVHSDLASAIGGVTASVSASDMSDIASRVWATTEGTRVDSRILVIQSMVSDVDSQLLLNASNISDIQSALDSQFTWTSGFLSDMNSDLSSQIGGIAATVTASDMSDIASRVWATAEGTRVDSRILVIQSMVSDVDSQLLLTASQVSDTYSLLSGHHSDFQSRVAGTLATSDQLSGVQSDLRSYLAGMSGMLSDVDSQLLLNASVISDVQSALDSQFTYLSGAISDAHSDLGSQIDAIAVTVTASDMSDIASRVWATAEGTRVDSRILVIQSMVSDVDSQVLLNTSMVSDVQSALDSQFAYLSNAISDAHSDLGSQIGGITASVSASDISDIASAVWAADHSTLGAGASSFGSLVKTLTTSDYLSQVHSDLYSAIGNVSVTLTASDISDIASATAAAVGSDISNIESALDSQFVWTSAFLSDMNSDLSSQIGGIAVTVTASDMSDIASRVWATAEGTRVDSRILVIQSMVSDVDSQVLLNASMISDTQSALDSQFTYLSAAISDAHSDLGSQIDGVTATVSASDMSDIASRVWAEAVGARVDSRIVLLQSNVSDVESQVDLLATSDYLSQVHSDLASAVGAVTASVGASDISDIASAVWADATGAQVDSRILVLQSNLSDVESQVDLNASMISDTQSALDSQFTYLSGAVSDAHSDLGSKIGNVSVTLTASDISDIASAVAAAGLSVTASDMSDIASRVWAESTRTLTQSAASVTAAVSGSDINVTRGDSLSASLTGLGDISSRTKLWFTVKTDWIGDADTAAIIQIEETAGLVYLNGAAAGTAANGDITVDDAAAGNITITLDEAETDDLAITSGLFYDVQMYDGSDVTTLTAGTLNVNGKDVTRVIS